jgi:diaminopimelate decarboxylase
MVRTDLDACLSVRDGRLFVEECDAAELAARHGTPLFVVSEDQLRRTLRRIRDAFASGWTDGPVRVLPSIKANVALALRRILNEEGAGCDAFGAAELEIALRAGVDPAVISVNGPKDQATVNRAVTAGAKVTLDHVDELALVADAVRRLGRPATIRPRVRPDLAGLDMPSDWLEDETPVRIAAHVYKAGIPAEDVLAMGAEALAIDGVTVSGVHVHVGRHRSEPAYWAQVIDDVADFLGRMRDAWGGWIPGEIDVGGGLPVPRDPFGRDMSRLRDRPTERAPDVEAYAGVITETLRGGLRRVGMSTDGMALEVEPGRALYGDAGVHLTTVTRVKRQERPLAWTWVETDSSENFLPDVFLEHNRWFFVVANRADAPAVIRADVVGASCNPDRILPEADLPAVEPGDVIAVLDTGAYQDALANNFNALSRPATLLVTGDRSEVIRRAETLDDVLARDVVPSRLAGGEVVRLPDTAAVPTTPDPATPAR